MSDHLPCCALSVECLLCYSSIGEPCDSTCSTGAVCTCDALGRPCCPRHYAVVSS